MNTATIRARVAAELAVHRGDLAEAILHIENALVTAKPEDRPDLEEARSWLDDLLPARKSLVARV